MNCTICGRWFDTTVCPGPHTIVIGPVVPALQLESEAVSLLRLALDAAEARAAASERQVNHLAFEADRAKRDRHIAETQRDAALARVAASDAEWNELQTALVAERQATAAVRERMKEGVLGIVAHEATKHFKGSACHGVLTRLDREFRALLAPGAAGEKS